MVYGAFHSLGPEDCCHTLSSFLIMYCGNYWKKLVHVQISVVTLVEVELFFVIGLGGYCTGTVLVHHN